ncbi:MAG: hypothetical protein J0H69_17905 [Burkholderiales bacterium]|nr:hypothetical protein [Burkholderiales bacterium]
MTKDIVVTIIHRDSTGHEDMIRLRSREHRPGEASMGASIITMPLETRRRLMEAVFASDPDHVVRGRLKDIASPDIFQQAGSVILKPQVPRSRKIPTACAVATLPDGLGDAVPPLRLVADSHLTLDAVSESVVAFGLKRSEAQFLVLYVSDIVDETLASGAAKSVSISLDSMSVVAKVERTTAADAQPEQLRVLIVMAGHGAKR